MVLRSADAFVGDYTDDLIDYLVLDRPVAAYAPDLEEVTAFPGLVHELSDVVPGPVLRTWDELRAAFDGLLAEATPEQRARHARVRDELHRYVDGRSAARVVRLVQERYLPIEEWLAEAAT
jgi:CDP-glycerol glycerophosphotransferase (TagB/SpsB family)